MEALDDILRKRRSWAVMMDLLSPYIAPQNVRMIRPAEEQWNAIPLQRQRQIYVTLWEQKLRGLAIKNHPYYAIKDCVPMPFNWNGTEHIKSMMANFKMVSAKYYNRYGIYTVQAANRHQTSQLLTLFSLLGRRHPAKYPRDVNLKKCLGWHFELERHGSGLSESIEFFSVCRPKTRRARRRHYTSDL